ncbi:hypothetical protein Bpfe_003577 [Biomphalaria pfeifferi]|uniref:Peptidase S1 domain-containing protein n=1 Tax=Biomphalaria pfeifferi TaxID=112525 RepID=A0AAD8C5P0_BIOPF|nr:hypothetical protein Bpfe_003576 [Biomphalaria pfeifferi]KAK0066842.1 hypothetical protein Bpfe_003577 [Biomphalaria pfeifferi]
MGSRHSKFEFFYGTHETAESQKELCSKPHIKQYEISKFSINDLPEDYQEENIFLLIKQIVKLTVQIVVNYISENRLDVWQNTKTRYPGSECKGKDSLLRGSGRIADIYKNEEAKKCMCSDCVNNENAEKETWTIIAITATHVVFDESEANKSNCKLYYDSEDGECIQINYCKRRWAHTEGDLCFMECVTCNKNLAEEIWQNIQQFNNLWKKIRKDYLKNTKKYKSNRLVVIVSHPHCGAKKISIGHLEGKNEIELNNQKGYQLFYDTPTCKGSSGAPVYLYGQNWFRVEYVHSGGTKDPKLNHSTTWCPK